MEALAIKGKATIEQLPFHSAHDKKLVAYFETLRTTMARLHAMPTASARTKRAPMPTSDGSTTWCRSMRGAAAAPPCGSRRAGTRIYYDRSKILYHQPIIADVHTQPTDEAGNPVGRVLHVGTGFPHMLVATLQHDGGKNRQTYRGYVSTYSEQITKDFKRLDDETWRAELEKAPPTPPLWLEPLIAH